MPVKGNGPEQNAKRYIITVLAALLLSGSISVEGPAAQKADKPEPTPQCLSYEKVDGCGCSLKITRLRCAENRPALHFFSELHQGAPLWVNVGGRELSLRSRLPRTDSFEYGKGDRWREDYEGDNVKVRIQYRPGKSSCPKENDPDGCEYFDVAADVAVTVDGGRPRTYKAVGACGC
jgi:hypothetical protein